MKFATILAVIATALALEDLEIEVTKKIPAAACRRKTTSGDMVSVHYRGTLEDGTEFDASYNRGQPISFPLGGGRVIQGWDQGLLDMCVGEKRTLTIPPELGYGSRGVGPIPANSVLIFETELVAIGGYDPEEFAEELEDDEVEGEQEVSEEDKENEDQNDEL